MRPQQRQLRDRKEETQSQTDREADINADHRETKDRQRNEKVVALQALRVSVTKPISGTGQDQKVEDVSPQCPANAQIHSK